MSLLIRGGTVVNHDHSERADVLITDKRIVAVGLDLVVPDDVEIIDVQGCFVLPGGIDPHTHLEFSTMGTVTIDDFEIGTMAAVSGGTTMVMDFCIPRPGQTLLKALDAWYAKAKKAVCDYGFHMTITWWHEDIHAEMAEVVERHGINTFKHFLAYKDVLMVDDDELFSAFTRCAELGAMPMVHAENGDVIARMQDIAMARGLTGPEAHAYSRPPECEGEATNRAIMVADMTEVPLYVVHTSCSQAHDAIARARAAGQRVYGEPLIQHLVLDDSDYLRGDWDYAAARVMSPPFRAKSHQDSLWAGLQSGSLHTVGTDHSAFTLEQKRLGAGDFRKIPNGTAGLEDRMPVLWTAGVNSGRLTREEFVAVTSTNAARIFNIYPRKGAIRAGSDADLVVWDPTRTKTISAQNQRSRTTHNVFEGFECRGLPAITVVAGKIAYRNGVVEAKAGEGSYVGRAAFQSVQVANTVFKQSQRPKPIDRLEVMP